jgi:hypothetical protein
LTENPFNNGGKDMNIFKAEVPSRFIFATLFAVMIISVGCGGIKYSYDPGTTFSGLKSYTWTVSSFSAWKNPLVEVNVRFVADQVLEKKGFKKTSEKPDLLISINYDSKINSNYEFYQLRMLTLDIYRAETKELIWRGTASGTINTDAASSDLKKAIRGILANLPPK